MLKIYVNGNEVIALKATMDLRIGKELKIMGSEYYIESVESTREYVRVDCVDEYSWKSRRIDASTIRTGTITSSALAGMSVNSKNPFDRR
ncbi:hypothetical protein [Romboutsia sp.]|uniref:hypothetical protein n=1 Tax=Romboutsia sp. TaxID=1965302 RepID=UPI002CBF798E|nr:hypothetical protein [Romboutsia sp.]HSQ89775.1 hypothetical protein [Romboutsia sp.]